LCKGRNLSLTNRKVAVKGQWNFNNESGQFEATLKYPKGNAVIRTDNSSFLGGNDSQPEPIQYFLFGIAASYASSFANSASIRGILLKDLTVRTEAKLNYSYFFSIGDDPKIEEINISVTVESSTGNDKLTDLRDLSYKCCPALSALGSNVNVNINLVVKNQMSMVNSNNVISFN